MKCNYKEIFNKECSLETNLTGYNLLEKIHLQIFQSQYKPSEQIKRYEIDTKEYQIVDICVDNLLNLDLKLTNHEQAYIIANNISILYLYQPFKDGNTRTLFLFFKYLLSLYGLTENLLIEETEIRKIPFFSVYYNLNEIPNESNIEYISRKLALIKTF